MSIGSELASLELGDRFTYFHLSQMYIERFNKTNTLSNYDKQLLSD